MNVQPQGERAIVVGVGLKAKANTRSSQGAITEPDVEESLTELAELAESAGAAVIERVIQVRQSLDAATLVGSGKVEEIQSYLEANSIDTVIFDHELTPTQLRNLERLLPAKVLDRTQLILDIFASRARTAEGQLQVELAQLNYLLPRLTGRGTEMSPFGRWNRNAWTRRNAARNRSTENRQADFETQS